MNALISRSDAIDALKICDNNEDGINCHKCPLRDKRWDGAWQDDETNCYTKLMRDSAKLLEMPLTQPERQRGAWIEYIPGYGKCPFCGNQVDLLVGKVNNFCGECGADMRGE